MTKNGAKILEGIRELVRRPDELISGKVVGGSYDATTNTISVQPTGREVPIEGVVLCSVEGEDGGVILVPKDGSNVIVGCVDGAGLWCVVKTGELEQAIVKTGILNCVVDATGLRVDHSGTMIEIGSLIKVCTAGENLHGLLKDLIVAIKAITVSTSSGPSGVPINIASFVALEARLNNLLTP